MLLRLNKRSLEDLKPAAAPYEARDTDIKGFLLRIEPGGTRSWFYQYRMNGIRARFLLGRSPGVSPDGARELAKIAAGDVARGIDPQARRKQERQEAQAARYSTLSTFLERFETWEAEHLRVRHAERIKRVFPKAWLTEPLIARTRRSAENWRADELKAGKKASTVNRDLAALKSVLSKAADWGVIDRSPLEGLTPLKTDPIGRVRFLTKEEDRRLRKVLRARDAKMRKRRAKYNKWLTARGRAPFSVYVGPYADHIEPLILTLLGTGMRFGEAANLRGRDVNLKEQMITVAGETAKSGRTRVIPMHAEVHKVLSAWLKSHPLEPDEYVFPGNDGARLTSIKTAWRAAIKKAVITGFRIHDLRHTFASRVKRAGADLYTVQRLLGHASPLMTQRYSHLQPDDLRAAVEAIK
jgi:integrase